MDLYHTLGVKKNASLATLKRAYRKRCLEHHPDRGGDAERFRACQTAFEVLSDKDKRKRYDETGEWTTAPDTTQQQTLLHLFTALRVIVGQLLAQGIHPRHRDVVKLTGQQLDAALEDLAGRIAKLEAQKAPWIAVRDGIEALEGANLLGNMAGHPVADLERDIAALRQQEELVRRARAELKRYRYKMDVPPGIEPALRSKGIKFTWSTM